MSEYQPSLFTHFHYRITMKVEFWLIGKTAQDFVEEGTAMYAKRLKHYLPFEMVIIPGLKKTKGLSVEQIKTKEGEEILKRLNTDNYLILLDDKGKQYTSPEFAVFMERLLQQPQKKAIFLVGGAYGFSKKVYDRANTKFSLSKMTFSHQMVRVFFTEQLYRAMTILKNEPYHH